MEEANVNTVTDESTEVEASEKDESLAQPEDTSENNNKNSEAGEDVSTQVEESPLTIHAISLRDNNILPGLDIDELKKLEGDESRFEYINKSISQRINDEIEGFINESTKEFQEYVKARDSGLSLEEFSKIKSETIKYEKIDESKLEDNVEIQKSVSYEALKERGYSDEDITDILERREEKGVLEENAKKDLKYLKGRSREKEINKTEEARSQKGKTEKYEEEQRNKIIETISNTDEIIAGVKLEENEKKELKKILTVPVRYDKQGNPIGRITEVFSENPHQNQLRLAYYIMKGLFSKDKVNDKIFSKDAKGIKKEVVKELIEGIKKSQKEQGIKTGDSTVKVNKKDVTSQDIVNSIPVNIEYVK